MFDFSSMIYTVPALLIAITIHEYAHALTADAMGDPTPRYLGRLTFNPLAHLDILGAIMLALFHFGWAKPVAINPNNFRNRREGMIKVSYGLPFLTCCPYRRWTVHAFWMNFCRRRLHTNITVL